MNERTMKLRFARALLAFLLLPGVVAFVVPWYLHPSSATAGVPGVVVIAAGAALLLWCVRDFYASGRGTLAPWDPPQRLVIVGLYRFTRNPMYVAVLVMLAGWALAYGSRTLWLYAGVVALLFHIRVILFEEPWLARRYAADYAAYRARVPRWLLSL